MKDGHKYQDGREKEHYGVPYLPWHGEESILSSIAVLRQQKENEKENVRKITHVVLLQVLKMGTTTVTGQRG